jgi:hypothetical protein
MAGDCVTVPSSDWDIGINGVRQNTKAQASASPLVGTAFLCRTYQRLSHL